MKRYLIILIVILVLLGGFWFFAGREGNLSTQTTASNHPVATKTRFDIADSGMAVSIPETSRISIELPAKQYAADALTISPQNILGETFGADARPGDWVRTFEVAAIGDATITVPSKDGVHAHDFTLVVHGVPAE